MKTASQKISLILGSHAHVSYGADAAEFERVYADILRPFVSCLYKYPRIQAVLHYSGVLLHWVERTHQELFMLIEDMVARKQVEMLGGGFYEPILPIIPHQDKMGQIELLTTYIRKQFGRRPQGCWVPEYAWEQGLVGPLVSCGMGFTFLSERQFALAGVAADAPCICEDQGKLITVFPVSQTLESALAGKSISALLEDFSRTRTDSMPASSTQETLVTIFPGKTVSDNGESPDNAWNRFFEELSLCESFVETVSPGKLFRRLRGLRKVYVPDSVGDKDAVLARRFIIAHPEAGRLYSKMIFTNMLVGHVRGDKARKDSAYEELWKAQGSVLFCRTGQQGLYGNALRSVAYSAMLGAERITRGVGKFEPSLLSYDINMDGEDEWLFQEAKLNCYVQPGGGGIFEMDYLSKTWNYLNTCGDRIAFSDRLLPVGASVEKLTTGAVEGARLCQGERYELADLDKVRRRLRLVLHKSSRDSLGSVEIEKNFAVKKDSVSVKYSLANGGTEPQSFCFAPEVDLSLPGETDAFVRFFACKSGEADDALTGSVFPSGTSSLAGLARGVDGIKIHDLKNEVQITLSANKPCDIRIVPVHVSDGASKLFQTFCVMPFFRVSLEAGKTWDTEFVLKFSH